MVKTITILPQDPNLLATLSAKELEMLKSINNDDLAPPPSDEDIFGQIESIKKQFEEENSQLTRQLEENKVDIKPISITRYLTLILR